METGLYVVLIALATVTATSFAPLLTWVVEVQLQDLVH
jgi:hypothetical protein